MAKNDGSPAGLRRGQSAIVTGAGSGIGRAIALALAAEGLQLTLVGRDADKLTEVARVLGDAATVLTADLTTDEGLAKVSGAAAPALHVLVHSAGIYLRTPFAALSQKAWTELEAVNLHAPILLTTVCLTALRAARGQVIFINSTAVQQPGAGLGAYAASKQALKAATEALRAEVNADGIRVTSIFPGRTDTPMQQAILTAEGRSAAAGTLLDAHDVAQMAVAALKLPASAEVTEIVMRPMRPL